MNELLGCVQMVANMLMRDEKPARAEAALLLKVVAAEAQAKLTDLRAFKAACEGQEAVAIVGELCHVSKLDAVARGYPVGGFLYYHPDPEAARLRMRVKELEQKCVDLQNWADHFEYELSTRDQQIDALMKTVEIAQKAILFSRNSDCVRNGIDACNKALYAGERKKHMKGNNHD